MTALFASLGGDLFELGLSPGEKVSRCLLVFAFLLVALRLGGKRELAQINVPLRPLPRSDPPRSTGRSFPSHAHALESSRDTPTTPATARRR